ncbi:class I adenylate-forming enzyme family protein [Actinocrispum sp. NPDC049592]|uniref:class I adenylate-forming enzyme family protein n=1 Tax=Actinocrispum sp. NPDC049592 TaxID=3154835 RepID=UPI003419E628
MTRTAIFRDLVPARLRRQWATDGTYQNLTLYQRFLAHVAPHPAQEAVIDDDGTTSYWELAGAAEGCAAGLLANGVTAGDVVAINLANGWRACAVDLACAAIGAIALPYPVGRGRDETLAMLRRSGAVCLIAERVWNDARYDHLIADLKDDLPELRRTFFHNPGRGNDLDRLMATARAADLLAGVTPPHPDAPARILVSSGSEAEPKMVLYSHNALADGRGRFINALHSGTRPMRSLYLVPLASSFGSTATACTLAKMGGTVLVRPKFEAAAALRIIDEHRPTHVLGVPTTFQKMMVMPEMHRTDTSSLIAVVCGGARIDADTVEEVRRTFGCAFVNLYGSADGVNSHTALDDPPDIVKSTVGRPDPLVNTIRILDPNGEDCPVGTEGEVWSRGPMSPLCYVNAPELDETYRNADGWVHTGDRGSFGEDGRLRISGRGKEIIIRGGQNISPTEIELQLRGAPGVLHAVCVGVADKLFGERVCACIVPADLAHPPSLKELCTFLTTQRGLETFKLPEFLLVLAELPMSPAGKVDKNALRRFAAESRALESRERTV